MSLEQKGFFEEFVPHVSKPDNFSHVIYGVDVYTTPECANKDGEHVDLSRRLKIPINPTIPLSQGPDLFYSSRFLDTISCSDLGEVSFDSVEEVLRNLKDAKFAYLKNGKFVHKDGDDEVYLISPLTHQEIQDLGLSAIVPLDAKSLKELLIVDI